MPAKPCTFYIFRHGQTQWNIKKIIQGHKDSPLTEEGLEAARSIAKVLKTVAFDAVYSSDLLRAKKTAQVLAREHKLTVMTTKLLRERAFGQYEGYTLNTFAEELKDMIREQETLSAKERYSSRLAKGIESDEEVMTRFFSFIRRVSLAYAGKNVAVVAHGGVLRTALITLGYASYQDLGEMHISNLAYFILESDGVDFAIKETHGIAAKKK